MPVTRAELRAEVDRWKAMHKAASDKLAIADLQNSEMRKALEQYVNVFLPGGISPANDLFKPGGLLHEGSDVCGKSLKREGQS